MAEFEGKERRIERINKVIEKYNLKDLDNCKQICLDAGIDTEKFVKDIQPICFENAVWAYTLGTAIAIKQKETSAMEVTKYLGEGLDAFTVPYSVADNRKIGIGHGELAR